MQGLNLYHGMAEYITMKLKSVLRGLVHSLRPLVLAVVAWAFITQGYKNTKRNFHYGEKLFVCAYKEGAYKEEGITFMKTMGNMSKLFF